MTRSSVLVAGAGPTGLTLACDLARRGVDVRIIDKAPRFPRGSRGKGLSPRSLEVLEDLGVIDRILAAGVSHLVFRKYAGAEVIADVDPEADLAPTPDAPYRNSLLITQWRVEEILRERLAGFGVAVELGAELTGFTQDEGGVAATVNGERIDAAYLVACDGGRSGIRRALGVGFDGRTDETQRMAVGDVEVEGLSRAYWHQWFGADGAIMLCPLPGTDAFQVQASPELDTDGNPLEPTLRRFQRTFDRVAGVPGVRLHNLTWRSTYRVNVRMADRFRVGRVFLAGDAAHVHPIAGGLGMNTGIQDAYNLGWKLALVLAGSAGPDLLDTYEEERLPVAAWLLDTTSERLAAVLDAIKEPGGGMDAVASPELSQLGLGYRWSRLSRHTADGAGGPHAGDRAPDAPCGGVRLFDAFRGPHFTLLGFGAGAAGALGAVTSDVVKPYAVVPPGGGAAIPPGDAIEVLTDDGGHGRRAYGDDRLVLVRPDGYLGLVAPADDVEAVADYLKVVSEAGGPLL